MTLPRRVAAGATYFISRRTSRRYFFFRPDPDGEMQRIFRYTLAVAAAKHSIDVHAAVLMSTHIHLVVTDTRGVYPDFLRDFHASLANATKCHRGSPEEVFNKAQASVVRLLLPEAVVMKIAYTLANPVEAGTVRFARDWPGPSTRIADIGGAPTVAARPGVYFRDESAWPETVELRYTMPPGLAEHFGGDDAARHALKEATDERERHERRKLIESGRAFLGPERVIRASIWTRARSREEWGSRDPTFAAAGHPGVARAAVAALREFRAAYRLALDAWVTGIRNTVFPHGTWLMRVLHGAHTAPAPA